MKDRKGFTLVELLVSIVIISLLSGMGIIGYQSFFKTAEDRYFDALESSILLAGNDYFEDHRSELPVGNNYSEVSLASLIDSKYIEPIADTKGNECRNGSVFAYRENNKFKYEVCIVECGGYSSTGRYCANASAREIVVSARTKNSNQSYDVTKSFNAVNYTKNENIVVTLDMNSDYNITRYVLKNTNGGAEIVCNQMDGNTCSTEISTTGTYKIVAYDDDMEISSRYINAKIARNGSNFTLRTTDGKTKYLISNAACSTEAPTTKVLIDIIKGNAKEEYKSVEYKINDGEYEETNRLRIEKELPSGHYEIEVVVTNYNDNVSIETISFDVSYLINLSYDDNTTATHEVVKGKNYNYVSELPVLKQVGGNILNVSWYRNEAVVLPTDIVADNCTYTLDGVTVVSYAITYNLNGGTATNPTIYNERTETFTLNNPTKSGSTFLGWTGSNDISTGLSGYTTTNPYVAGARDNTAGNEFTVTSGNTYRIFLTAKKTAGTLKMQGGIWYTEQTSGSAWDGYATDYIEIDSLGNGWARYYKDVTVPAGKTKGRVYVQLQQWPEALATTWQIADVHVVPATSTPTITISKGSTGDKVYNAYWKASHTLTLNLNGGTISGSTTLTNPSGTVFAVPHTPTKGGYTFTGWTLSGGGIYDVYDTSVAATETKTFNYNSASSTLPYTYNNSNNGTVTLQMVADSTATGGYALKVTTNGTASPGTGGFWLNALPTTPGRINVLSVTAKIPTGYTLLDGGNGTLYRGYGSYIDDTQNVTASGRWLTYYLYYYTGNTGEISENIYMHLSGSNNTSVTWYVNSIVVKSYTREQFKSRYTFGGSDATLTANWRTSGSGVTFNTNGGTFNTTYVKSWNNGYYNASATSALRHYSYNESIATPPASGYNWVPDSRVTSRTGYIFDGWYTAASGGTKIFNVDGTLVASVSGYSNASKQWIKYDSNVTVYAHWISNNFSIKLDNQNANTAGTTKVYYILNTTRSVNGVTCYYYSDSSFSTCLSGGYTITKPTKEGYDFGGYYTGTNGTGTKYVDDNGNFINNIYQKTPSSINTNYSTEIILYAKWIPKNYKITFNYNGGNVGALTKTVTYGNTYTDLPTPTRAGYTFGGWYGSYNGSSTYVNYGRAYMYTNKQSIHFSAYMSNWANYARAISCTETGGWNLESTSSAMSFACYDSGSGYKNAIYNAAPSTLSAGWHDFDLIFNGTNAKLYIDGSLKGTSANYSSGKIGYNSTNSIFFGGEATGSGTAASSPFFNGYIGNIVIKNTDAITPSNTYNTITAPAQDQTLYAKWIPNMYYLDLNGWLDGASNGGISGYGTCDVYVNGTQVANDVTDYFVQHPAGSTYEFKDCKATTGHTYNGVYSGSMSGTIGSSNVATSVKFTTNSYTVTLAGVDPITTSFGNQTLTLAGNVAVPVFESSAMSLSTNTPYVVSFDYKCASGTNQFDVDFFPDTLPQTNPTATTSWQHMDWITSSSHSNMSSAKLRFFDDFQASNESDITISNIMLSRTTTKSVKYGATYGDLTTPSRSGYTFVGWYTASNGGTKITSSSTMNTAGNHTLYARWSKNAVTYTKKTFRCQYASWATSVTYISGTSCTTSGSSSGSSYTTCDLVDSSTYCHSYNNKCWKRTTYTRNGCSTWFTTPESTETGLSSCTPSQDFYTKVTCE